jgi:stress response protein SCP2
MSFGKDGYSPGEAVQMIIDVDNTNCKANINSISISVTNYVTLRSQGRSTGDTRNVFSKVINGVPAGMAYTVSGS